MIIVRRIESQYVAAKITVIQPTQTTSVIGTPRRQRITRKREKITTKRAAKHNSIEGEQHIFIRIEQIVGRGQI